MAHAQYLGYSVDSTKGTVSIFGIVTTDQNHGNQDHLIATVNVGVGPTRVAVSPDPTPDKVYVTNQGDNSLWVIDVTNVAQGMVTAQNVNVGNFLQLNQPDGIVLTVVLGNKTEAYIANLGNGTVSIVDTSTNSLIGTPLSLVDMSAGLLPCCSPPFIHMDIAADDPQAAASIWVTEENSAGQGYPWLIFPNSGATPIVNPLGYNNGLQGGNSQGVTVVPVTDGGGVFHNFAFLGFNQAGPSCTGGACIVEFDDAAPTEPYFIPLSTAGNVVAITSYLNTSNGQTLITVFAADSNANLYQITIDCSGTSCGSPTVSNPLQVKNSVNSLALTPDGALLYVSEGPAGSGLELVDAGDFCVTGSGNCFAYSPSSLPFATPQAGLAISNVDVNSAPLEWFIGAPPPAVVAIGSQLPVTAIAMANTRSQVNLSLSFGNNQCNGSSLCAGTAQYGETSVGGESSSLPPGVVPVTITGSSGGNSSSSSSNVGVGASCTFTATPSRVATGAAVNANLACVSPAGESLSGVVAWGDGTSSTQAATTDSTSSTTIPFTHVYTNPSGPTYQITESLNDVTENAPGTVTPPSVAVTVTPAPPSCSLAVTPASAQAGQAVTGTLSCTGIPGDSLTGTVTWGDNTSPSASIATVGSTGSATITVTHMYSSASTPTYSVAATISDTTTGVSGSVSNSPAPVTITSPAAPPSCSLVASPTSAQTGQAVISALSCTGTAGDSLTGTVTWGDGSSPSTSIAIVGTTGSAMISVTHIYSKASAPTYSVTATIADTTTGSSGSVSNSPTPVTITSPAAAPPICTLAATPASADTTQNVTANLSCNAPAGDSLSGTISWGDSSASSASSATADSSGKAQVQLVHMYSAAGSFNISGTVTDTTSGLTGSVTPGSVAVTVNASGPAITPGQPTQSVAEGQPAQYALGFAGGASEANLIFALACQAQLPTGATCTFAPTSLTLDASGNGTSQLTIATTGPSAAAQFIVPMSVRPTALAYTALLFFPSLACIGWWMPRSKSTKKAGKLLALLLFGIVTAAWIGCGGGSGGGGSPPPPAACTSCTIAGTYSVKVTATSTAPALTSSTTVQLVVTQ